ncbi:MAG TPA: peptide-N4-asparagine amidase [Terriglobia bacterium]|nr:peptide-N4-asparagine amidase [Terriglobia bacterium]
MDTIPHAFTYHPPASCKAPWAKVVLIADFFVDPGHQYDRTASIWLEGVNIYFGTTEEPSPDFGPSWQIERDLTDYSSLLLSPGKGDVLINNWIDPLRASVIHASARILFYPAARSFPPPRTPDMVFALNPANAPANLQTGGDELQREIKFPQNTARIYLDVFPQSQFHDEFWYTCLPEKYIPQTAPFAMKRGYKGAPKRPRACSGGSYREVEVLVDGQPAGLAPIYPWIYTGGIDPYLWRPTPGVQTINFIPYRVDLTPFAGDLSLGEKHSVAVRVLGSNHYFSVAAAVLIYRDPKTTHTGGAVTRNTLKGLSLDPAITSTLGKNPVGVNGDVLTHANQKYVIEGYVNTPAGRVRNRVEQTVTFANTQKFASVDPETTRHTTEYSAHAESTSSSIGGTKSGQTLHRAFDYSLSVSVLRHSNLSDSRTHTVRLQQTFDKKIEQREADLPPYTASVHNSRTTADQVNFNIKKGHVVLSGNRDQTSIQTFSFSNSLGDCYKASLRAQSGRVSSLTEDQTCSAHPMHWFVHPTGSPGSFGWRKSGPSNN